MTQTLAPQPPWGTPGPAPGPLLHHRPRPAELPGGRSAPVLRALGRGLPGSGVTAQRGTCLAVQGSAGAHQHPGPRRPRPLPGPRRLCTLALVCTEQLRTFPQGSQLIAYCKSWGPQAVLCWAEVEVRRLCPRPRSTGLETANRTLWKLHSTDLIPGAFPGGRDSAFHC